MHPMCCSENSPTISETPKPRDLSGLFSMNEGEMLSVFFWAFFLETVPLHFAAFRSSIRLRFLSESFWQRALKRGVRGFLGRSFLAQKCPFLRPENGKEKFSLT